MSCDEHYTSFIKERHNDSFSELYEAVLRMWKRILMPFELCSRVLYAEVCTYKSVVEGAFL